MNEFEIHRIGQLAQARQAAADERAAVESANACGLAGQAAEQYKAKFIRDVEQARAGVRRHVQTIIESPEGQARPEAAREVAFDPNLTTDQALAKLAAMPVEADETAAAAAFILGAGR